MQRPVSRILQSTTRTLTKSSKQQHLTFPRHQPLSCRNASSSYRSTYAVRDSWAMRDVVLAVGVTGSIGWVLHSQGLLRLGVVHSEAPEVLPASRDIDPLPIHPLPIIPKLQHLSTADGSGDKESQFLESKSLQFTGFYLDDEGVGASKSQTQEEDIELIMRRVLASPAACAIRIVPTRNTDFSHLRDGFTRALVARRKVGLADGSVDDKLDERITASLQEFKSFFPNSSVPKGKELLLVRLAGGKGLAIEYEGKVLGQLADPWVAREMMMAYFVGGRGVISEALKEDVAKGLKAL